MKYIIFVLTLAFLASCTAPEGEIHESSFSDYLGYGSHEVGFKTLFTVDLSRESVPYSDWSGRLYPEEKNAPGRQLPIHIWYPAEKTAQSLKMEHFVHLLPRQSADQPSNDSLARQISIYQTNELGGGGNFTEEKLNQLLELQTRSYLNAKASPGKFPLVIFPNGTSPAYTSIMCEYLASHGYVVAGMALKGQFSHVLETSVVGLEVAIDDLEFGLQQLLELPYVDGNQIALLGNAIESSFCAGLASRNNKIKALVSLDGGLLSRFEQDILNETVFYHPERITLPILAIYAPHPSISPDHIYDLKYSDRYFAHFPEMSEFHFLNFGVFEEYIPGIIGEAPGDTKGGVKAAAVLSLAFLNAQLKGDRGALTQAFSENPSGELETHTDTLFMLKGLPAPPNITRMKHIFITQGMDAIDSIYQQYRTPENMQPFSKSFYQDFKNWLAWKKDSDFVNRKRLYEMAVESFPNSALHTYLLAAYLSKTGKAEEARALYLQARDLLETDEEVDQELMVDLKEGIEKALH